MERLIQLHVEALEEGGYVATSEEIQGLVAQGRTVQETLQIAQDVARRLLEAQAERSQDSPSKAIESSFDYQLVILITQAICPRAPCERFRSKPLFRRRRF